MASFWREPLVHFIILGAALFTGHALWQAHVSSAEYTINISTEELERQAVIFAGENRRQPTDEDLKALLFAYVEEQVLMREAQRLGLGEDDTIIRRRLAQKMRFMSEDVDGPATPDTGILKAWFEDNSAAFISPERRAFTHIYLSPESRGDMIGEDAARLLGNINSQLDQDSWKKMGDPFMMKRDYEPVSPADVTRLFGKEFSAALFALETDPNVWQGPVASAFGLHIIRVNQMQPETMPDFEDVRGSVLAAWLDESKRDGNQERLKKLIGKYKVNVEVLPPDCGYDEEINNLEIIYHTFTDAKVIREELKEMNTDNPLPHIRIIH